MAKEKEKGLPNFIQGRLRELLEKAPKTGTVDIRLKDKKTVSITLRSYLDPVTNEQLTFFDEFGREIQQKYVKRRVLNLEKLRDRIEFVLLENHPFFCKGANQVLVLINVEAEADDFVSTRELGIDANVIISKLSGAALRNFARLFFINTKIKITDNTSDKVVKKHLYDISDHDPKRIINEYNDTSRQYRELLTAGLHKGIFVEKHGVYMFNNDRMGTSFELAVEYLKDNEDILPKINALVFD